MAEFLGNFWVCLWNFFIVWRIFVNFLGLFGNFFAVFMNFRRILNGKIRTNAKIKEKFTKLTAQTHKSKRFCYPHKRLLERDIRLKVVKD